MDIEVLLTENAAAIVDDAFRATIQNPRYRSEGAPVTRRRMEALHRSLVEAVVSRDVTPLRRHVREVARERLAAGYALEDVQVAFAALEDAIWNQALTRLPSYDRPWGNGMVGTALAHGLDALRSEFGVAAPPPAPFPDLTPLFKGAEAHLAPCPAEEIVSAA